MVAIYGHMGDEKAIQIGGTFLNPSIFEYLGNFSTVMINVICSLHKLKKKAVNLSGNWEGSEKIGCMFRNNAMVHNHRIRAASNSCFSVI